MLAVRAAKRLMLQKEIQSVVSHLLVASARLLEELLASLSRKLRCIAEDSFQLLITIAFHTSTF